MDDLIQDDAQPISHGVFLTRLRDAKWFAFDLDDTLHSFRKASAAAVKAVLKIIRENSDHTLEELELEYKSILAQGTASAFVDGKTSHQYREDRFRHLAQRFDISLEDEQMRRYVDLYERILTENLELKPGVLDLLHTLKHYGYKVAVITEGPQDAQERTVKALGLAPYIDYLATTNKLRVSKIDGLFARVLEHLALESNDMIMTGDSWERDIVPATQAGMYCIYYSDSDRALESPSQQIRISQFEDLQKLTEAARH